MARAFVLLFVFLNAITPYKIARADFADVVISVTDCLSTMKSDAVFLAKSYREEANRFARPYLDEYQFDLLFSAPENSTFTGRGERLAETNGRIALTTRLLQNENRIASMSPGDLAQTADAIRQVARWSAHFSTFLPEKNLPAFYDFLAGEIREFGNSGGGPIARALIHGASPFELGTSPTNAIAIQAIAEFMDYGRAKPDQNFGDAFRTLTRAFGDEIADAKISLKAVRDFQRQIEAMPLKKVADAPISKFTNAYGSMSANFLVGTISHDEYVSFLKTVEPVVARLKESYNAQLSNSIAVQITLQRSRLKRSIVVNHLDAIPLRFD